MTITQSLAHFAVNLKYEDLPEHVVDKMKAILLHAIGIGLSGYNLENSVLARKTIQVISEQAYPEATMMGSGLETSIADIAFATSVMFHARIQEDSRGTTHIGTVCNPLGIALAQKLRKNGKELITALVAGYEVSCALCRDYTAISTAHGYRPTPMYGIFGATTTAGLLLGLTEEEMVNAYGFAHASTSGPLCPLSGAEGRFEPGIAARNGLMAAQIAKAGAIGNPEAMEYPRGFFQLYCGCEADAEKVTGKLGKVWEIMNCTVKTYPACQLNQTHIINMLALINEQGPFDVSEIESVVVEGDTYAVNYPGSRYWGPYANTAQTYNSAPFCMAVCLLNNRCTFADMCKFDDPDTLALLSKVSVEGNEELASLCSKVHVKMKNGKTYSRDMNITPDYYSYTFEEEISHLMDMKEEIPLSEEKLKELIRCIESLENSESVDEMVKATIVE